MRFAFLDNLFGRSAEQETGGEMPPGFARVIDEVLESVDELLESVAGSNPAGEGEVPKALNFSAEMSNRLGAVLLGKLTVETALEVYKSEVAVETQKLTKAQVEHCAKHKRTEQGLGKKIQRLESELERMSSLRREADRTVGRLSSVVEQYDALTAEITAAVAVGAPLTAAIIQEGIRKASLPYYAARTYLVSPPPPAQAPAPAEQAKTPGEEPIAAS